MTARNLSSRVSRPFYIALSRRQHTRRSFSLDVRMTCAAVMTGGREAYVLYVFLQAVPAIGTANTPGSHRVRVRVHMIDIR